VAELASFHECDVDLLGSQADAKACAEGVGAGARGTKASRDWHIYSYWEHILEQKTPTPEGCPFTCPYYKGGEIKYHKGMLPQTDALLSRAINISIGYQYYPVVT
jgi:8-amino-3,8-dideoxy-alpha-D-manno-octulosonate transaminase